MKELDYNYKDLKLVDLRYRGSEEKGFYILLFYNMPPVNIEKSFFENILFRIYGPLFKKDININSILEIKWNAYITKGFYMQWNGDHYIKNSGNPNRYYLSKLDKSGILSYQKMN